MCTLAHTQDVGDEGDTGDVGDTYVVSSNSNAGLRVDGQPVGLVS